jgi:ABC-type phosphate/phosphonate transport system substrate-binding protein
LALGGSAGRGLADDHRDSTLPVGMPQTFFHDLPPGMVHVATEPFNKVIQDATGLAGKLTVGSDVWSLVRDLKEGKLRVAIVHGFEYGWAREEHPELRPLAVAINSHYPISAIVLVRKDSKLSSFADLKNTDLSLPSRSQEPTRLYLERQCQSHSSCGSHKFFAHIVRPNNVESALDDLCLGKVQAVAVDAIGLGFYKELKPGCFARLRVLAASAAFPPPAVVYWRGAVDDTTLAKVRRCLQNSHTTPLGAELMKLWRITSFDPVPADYDQAVADCIKSYPCPERKK